MASRPTIKPAPSQIKPALLHKFHVQRAAWYKTHGRHDLPWRTTADPYRIWLSEVMLQQTQVATVRARFYEPFLAKFPTVEALANAPRAAVMKAWEGLGYYRRAGNLHEAARLACAHGMFSTRVAEGEPQRGRGQRQRRVGGASPPTIEQLLSLPGIGRNTAHAIAAFAYHQPVAILEANVKRVVARIFALEHPSDADLWAGAEALLDTAHPFDHNQAMMDIGSLVCTPKEPTCGQCPARGICQGKPAPQRYPAPKAKKSVPTRAAIILVRADSAGRLFLEARDAALLGGLYGFPQLPASTKLQHHWQPLGTVRHTYSHFKLIGTVMREAVTVRSNSPDWYSRQQIDALPLSTLDHKVLALVENCHTAQKKRIKPARTRRTR
jgi:A/G-specific adenine glycosylase